MSHASVTSILFVFGCVLWAGCNQPKAATSSPPPPSAESNKLEAVTRDPSETAEEEPAPVAAEKPAPTVASEKPAPPPPNVSGVRTHIVQRGETLWGISQKYYGDGKGWNKIYAANRNRIRDPKDVPTGTKLIIP